MSRKANCWDNAPMESFFGTLEPELVHQPEYPDRDTARRDLFAYIEGYYNRQRIHSGVRYITPEQADLKTAGPGVHFSGGKVRRREAKRTPLRHNQPRARAPPSRLA